MIQKGGGNMKKYRLVFTHVRRWLDVEDEVTEDKLVNRIQSMIGDGWMLSELTLINE